MHRHLVRAPASANGVAATLGAFVSCLLLLSGALAGDAPAAGDEVSAKSGSAVPTHLVIRARARGANYVTTDMGVKVTLRDTATGAVLAEGLTIGNVAGTDPQLTAAFRTTLSLTRPTHIEASIRAPLSYPHANVSASSTAWVLPGKHVTGEGWVLELPGFVVTFIDPPQQISLAEHSALDVAAKVVMMCGCPTEPGGRWDSSAYELHATLLQSDATLARAPLAYAGEKSTYHAQLAIPDAGGHYELMVTAYDPLTGNVGVARTPVVIR